MFLRGYLRTRGVRGLNACFRRTPQGGLRGPLSAVCLGKPHQGGSSTFERGGSQFLKPDANERGKREVGIEDLFKNQTKKLQAELDGLQRQNDQTKYLTLDNRLDHFSIDQLGTLSNQLDLKLELVKQKLLDRTDGEFDFLEAATGFFSAPPNDVHQQPLSYVKPLNQCFPIETLSNRLDLNLKLNLKLELVKKKLLDRKKGKLTSWRKRSGTSRLHPMMLDSTQ
ncbi:hypothetical protein NE237_013099 [Protea cynaroides]|uniref:Uncharacterized protein n=1 Tax=Protea cynaroides TaxID=273540 RepID=A0A9Q0GY05_9MAGN|nr:hypothetical protein NE237_013099 [Protea cynaroides]